MEGNVIGLMGRYRGFLLATAPLVIGVLVALVMDYNPITGVYRAYFVLPDCAHDSDLCEKHYATIKVWAYIYWWIFLSVPFLIEFSIDIETRVIRYSILVFLILIGALTGWLFQGMVFALLDFLSIDTEVISRNGAYLAAALAFVATTSPIWLRPVLRRIRKSGHHLPDDQDRLH